MKGYFNRILHIDLNERCSRYEEIPDTVLERALGAKGLSAEFLLERNPRGIDPLSPENLFLIATGPVTGTNMWGQNRFGVYSKSPATGGWGESYCGGTLAPKIKGCGIDALVLSGKAKQLSFVIVDEHGVRFENAVHVRMRETAESEAYLLKQAPEGAGAMVIGPAGENLAVQACIKVDRWRSLGRGGLGAVLGSKNVKGLAFSGTRKAEIADQGLLKDLVGRIAAVAGESPVTEVYRKYGTPSQVRVTNNARCFPTHYWSSGYHKMWENLSADYMRDHFDPKPHACPPCLLRCTNYCRISSGRHAGLEMEGPEYETIYALGGLNDLESLEEVLYLNDVCDRLGIDTMSAGNISGFMIEAFKRGKTDFSLDYNQPDRMAELFQMIARREGVGDLLARGIKHAAAELGLEELAVHVKGLEPAGFDPRVLKGMGLSYATASRGACHLRGTFYKPELSGEIDPQEIENKAELLVDYEDRAALFDCLILCRFYRDFIKWEEIAQLFEALCGCVLSKENLQAKANQITQNTRRYNRREGLGDAADRLPPRLLDVANAEGSVLTTEEISRLTADYNRLRGAH